MTLIYFHDGTTLDLDNPAKPVLDASKGTIYVDDRYIQDLIVRKRSPRGEARFETDSKLIAGALLAGEQFIYVSIDESQNEESSRDEIQSI